MLGDTVVVLVDTVAENTLVSRRSEARTMSWRCKGSTHDAVELVCAGEDVHAFVRVPWPTLGMQKPVGCGVVLVECYEAAPGLDAVVVPGCVLEGAVQAVVIGLGDDLS